MASRGWRSVRGRTTLGATVVVAVALLIGAFSFYGVLSASIHGSTERAAEQRLSELAERAGGPGGKGVDALDDEILQILGPDGSVRAASEEARDKLGSTPLPADDDPQTTTVDGDTVVVVSEDIDGDQTLVLAVSMDDDAETLATVATLLAIAVPLLLLLVAVTTWLVVGRALRPVERIREEVDGITAERLHQRVPVPETADEIAALATTMNGMLDRLDAAATAQRRFVSDASHELRSPLATIRQHAELAQAHPDVTSIGELAEVVSEEGLRLQGIVESLLLLARLDEGASTLDEAVDLDDIALSEVRRLRAAGLDVDGSGVQAARVHADPRLLGQLVRNLADNAVRHSRGRIAIGVIPSDGHVFVTVEDDGTGVPAEERERIFERFVRLDEARSRDAGGSGLGLAIARGIATRSRGTLTVDDSRWGGARFVLTLPLST
ncbi:sensor histidine kinase [Microbacterium maritypicum]|uniref:sensor histidine kinase n=1 Tax=Microbacterium TaxID=33882 RepID=UPI002629C565|nr:MULTISPECIES: HAMP domain-containing sensor histidine kinase [unclassified Microbacterium]MCV0334873.1 HAMP domain-containing histidine kinase [Microbacterium sp.]MCV0373948.1 HAMP domain-containing histidine kinase [Microbacterium sp.]MCV0391159.1 HAMP domain-containing histidine kinase [Microbacterium sp.]MCV0418554.1 HAMP domain-containing histidine kinase [Microbacterium sp.]MCV0422999.1 HAMP domain-containing histidine kinase [Microbacterium sp.]